MGASASYHCHPPILTSFLIMRDNNYTLQSRTIFPAAWITVTLNLNIYCLFYLAADIPINASLSKSKSDTSVLYKYWERLRKFFVHKSAESITYLFQQRKIKHMAIKILAITVTGVKVASIALINPLSMLSISPQFLTKPMCCCWGSAYLESPDGEYFIWLITSPCPPSERS